MAQDPAAAVQDPPAPAAPPAAVPPPADPPPAVVPPAAPVHDPSPDGTPKAPAGDPPTVPDKYELSIPEGALFDASDLEVMSAEAKAFGFSNDQAQALVNVRAEQTATAKAKWMADLTADKDLGGDHLPMTQQLARAGRDYLFPPGTPEHDLAKTFFDKSALGNHPAFVRAMVRLGKQMAEDRPHTGGGHSPNAVKDPATVLYGG